MADFVARVDREVGLHRGARRRARDASTASRRCCGSRSPSTNCNPGKALHGGCAASLAVDGRARGHARGARRGVGPVAHRRAPGELPRRRDRRGRSRARARCCGAARRCASSRSRSRATTASRSRTPPPRCARASARRRPRSTASRGRSRAERPGPMGPHIGKMPFTAARGLARRAHDGRHARASRMPGAPRTPTPSGGTHEGAVLALLDTTGAMAAWADDRARPVQGVDARRSRRRSSRRPRAAIWSPTAAACSATASCSGARSRWRAPPTGRVFARGTVIYRIVTN